MIALKAEDGPSIFVLKGIEPPQADRLLVCKFVPVFVVHDLPILLILTVITLATARQLAVAPIDGQITVVSRVDEVACGRARLALF